MDAVFLASRMRHASTEEIARAPQIAIARAKELLKTARNWQDIANGASEAVQNSVDRAAVFNSGLADVANRAHDAARAAGLAGKSLAEVVDAVVKALE